MGQSRKSQDAVEAIRLQDRVIEKSIRPPPVAIWPARSILFFQLLFVNSVQMDPGTRSPRSPRRVKPETPAIR